MKLNYQFRSRTSAIKSCRFCGTLQLLLPEVLSGTCLNGWATYIKMTLHIMCIPQQPLLWKQKACFSFWCSFHYIITPITIIMNTWPTW